ncbi:MAG TPA: TonB-dependent receptor [Gemmatimonadaceae bacterium]|nr:TonB-dependent receptor [Gemmatimonadaceae bacterium]
MPRRAFSHSPLPLARSPLPLARSPLPLARSPLTLALAAHLASCACLAQESKPARDTLSTVYITATRVAISTAAPTATVTVLRGDDLRAQGITRVLDALRLVPGAAVVASGPVGSQSSLFLRGGNSNYVRVLVDGVAVNDAGGAFDLATLTTDNVDRIEIVRGPTSVLYGSDAVTGVVQLFTKEGRGPLAMHALAGGGSRGTLRGALGVAAGAARAGFTLSGSRESSDGILPFNNRFVNDVLSASLRVTPGARADARLALRWSSATYHYPTDFTGAVVDHDAEQTDHRLVASLDAGHRLTERVELRVSLASNELLPRANDGPDTAADTMGFFGFFSRAVRTRRSADARLNLTYGRGVLTVGAEVARDRETSSSLSLSQYGRDAGGFAAARHNTGAYLQALGDATDRLSYAVGGRLDQNSAFGSFATARASAAYLLSARARVRASAGTALKAPSFFENFSTGYVTGNPSLRPERSRSADVGADVFLAGGDLTLRTTAYAQQFRDVIQYAGTPPARGAPNYFNVAAADASGLEFEAEYRGVERLTVGVTYAWTDARATRAGFDQNSGAVYVVGQKLIRRPPHGATLSAAYALRGGSVHLVAARVGERDDRDFSAFPAVAVTLPTHTKVDCSVVVPVPGRIVRGAALLARVDNLLGARYSEIARFAAPGRSVFVGVRVER